MNKTIVAGTPYFNTNEIPNYQKLTKNIEVDIAIIGGGITASLIAYELNGLGLNIGVFEKDKVASGSTSITTSLLEYQLDDLIIDLKDKFLPEEIMSFYQFSYDGLEKIKKIIKNTGINCEAVNCDSLLITTDENKVPRIKFEYETRKQYGFDVSYINKYNKQFGLDIKAGVLAHNGGLKINPVMFTHEIFSFLTNTNVFENVNIINIDETNDSCTLLTEQGYTISANKVIVATGYDTSLFTEKNYGNFSTTYNIVTSPIDEINEVIENLVIKTDDDPYYYFRTSNKRLIFGGEDTKYVPDITAPVVEKVKYAKLKTKLKKFFPEHEINIDYEYAGTFKTTKNNLCFVGRECEKSNVYFALCYGANGIVYAAKAGEVLKDLLTNKPNIYASLLKLI